MALPGRTNLPCAESPGGGLRSGTPFLLGLEAWELAAPTDALTASRGERDEAPEAAAAVREGPGPEDSKALDWGAAEDQRRMTSSRREEPRP